ncbi:MAG: ABC transporter substrate-binding protein [Paenibacillus dendritiformis]|uniref:ABC transporter substrate-binding protein n=1 Tax=uncultured Paenibacillus sp. TaxID=227322 RepID=UPI0025FEE73D|nr:ABC transporter substrate-binding protein [uncultured Paenibacillus sp.]MDU5145718.1 ABC transporter substrate-binding protein [Paenibacillus dendritiformis]
MLKKWKIALLLTMVVALLSGCFGEKPVLDELGKGGKGKIKVVYHNEDSFYRQYGNYFNVKYPDIEFEIVNMQEMYQELQDKENVDYEEERKKFLDKHKPDVLMIDLDTMEKLVQEGKLYNLDAVIAQEKFDLEGYMPGLVDMIRERGGGSLYGLAPYFYTTVIYYNAELFRDHNIEPPRNKMTWQEILDLSSRFASVGSGENQIYGYYQRYGGGAQELLLDIANASSLRFFDAKGEKLVFNTDGWKQLVKLTTDAIRNKGVYSQTWDEGDSRGFSSDDDLFFKGRAAMIMDGPWFISQIKNRAMWDKEAKPIDWGMVSVPVDPASPDESSYASLNEVYAIAADSPNKRAAWEFVKFVNGPEMAKAASRSMDGNLPTRNQFMKEIDGKSTEAFYALRPKAKYESMWGGPDVEVPSEFYSDFRTILDKELRAVIDNKKTVDEAVAAIQSEGEAALQKGREAEKARKEAEQKAKGEGGKAAEDNHTEGSGSGETGASEGD